MHDIRHTIDRMTDLIDAGAKAEDDTMAFVWVHPDDAHFYVLYKGMSYKITVEPN